MLQLFRLSCERGRAYARTSMFHFDAQSWITFVERCHLEPLTCFTVTNDLIRLPGRFLIFLQTSTRPQRASMASDATALYCRSTVAYPLQTRSDWSRVVEYSIADPSNDSMGKDIVCHNEGSQNPLIGGPHSGIDWKLKSKLSLRPARVPTNPNFCSDSLLGPAGVRACSRLLRVEPSEHRATRETRPSSLQPTRFHALTLQCTSGSAPAWLE